MEMNHPPKFGKDISRHCRVIGQMSFFKMAAWRPYWISDRAEMQSHPTLYRYESSLKIWERYPKAFSSYWSDVVWGGDASRLTAIKVKQYVPPPGDIIHNRTYSSINIPSDIGDGLYGLYKGKYVFPRNSTSKWGCGLYTVADYTW